MTRRVLIGCRDCRECSGGHLANAGRTTGAAVGGLGAAALTGGLSLLVRLFVRRRKCGQCRHRTKFHSDRGQ
jgi:hypothetical protein